MARARPPPLLLLTGLALSAALLPVVACGPPSPPEGLPSLDRFRWAEERFEAGQYGAAINGFREFILRDPLNALVDSAQYLTGEAYLRSGQVPLAIAEFEQITRNRPGSELADDAQFGLCRAHWRLSPKLALEQEDTRSAVEECGRLLQFFADSPWTEEAAEILARARAKLAEKSFRIGRYYFDNRLYESANIYFEKALEEAPDSPVVPEVLAKLYESYRRVGFETEAEAVRQRLLRNYPDTEAARDLRREGEGAQTEAPGVP